jgi:uncharacterized RDD family membrane protein YckC
VPKKSIDVRTAKSEIEVAESIDVCLRRFGFSRTGSKQPATWKKGMLWTIFASVRASAGTAHIEIWNYAPIPGMGSYLMYFINRSKFDEILSAMAKSAVDGEFTDKSIAIPEVAEAELPYSGFWKRVAAHLIDAVIILVPLLAILTAVSLIFNPNERMLLAVIASWLYFAISESSASQATYGKRIMKIKVADMNGDRIKFGRATGRFFGKLISAYALFVGFFMVGFTKKKQGLHDKMAGCLVINRSI